MNVLVVQDAVKTGEHTILMKITQTILSSLTALTVTGYAEIKTFAEYDLGESGLLLPPLDSSVDARDFGSVARSENISVGTDGVVATASTAYAVSGNGGWFAGPFADLPTDNFAVGIYARATALPAIDGTDTYVLTLGRGLNALRIALAAPTTLNPGGGGWSANLEGDLITPQTPIGETAPFPRRLELAQAEKILNK